MAARQREAALLRYYEAPVLCAECQKPIPVSSGQKIREVRKKRFCNLVCSNRNSARLRERAPIDPKNCDECGIKVRSKSRMCRSCNARSKSTTSTLTRGDLMKRRGSYQSARSSIRRLAVKVFCSSGKPRKCHKCGYDTYYEVCHIKAVKDFPLTALISDINHIDNLVALCPTHHWEFDNGLLTLL